MRTRILSSLLLAVLWALPASAQNQLQLAGNLGAVSVCLPMPVAGMGTGSIHIVGTWVGTITFTVGNTGDAADYVTINMKPPNDATEVTTTTGNGLWSGSVASFRFLRACMTSYTSGVASLLMSAAVGGGGGAGTLTAGDITLDPAGLATAAKQDSIIAKLPALGTAGTASADVITVQGRAAMTPILATLSGTNNIATVTTVTAVTAITNALPAGTNAIGKLAANSGVDIGDVDVTSSALPTGASTSAKQDTEITALQLIDNLPNTLGSTTAGQSGVLGIGSVTTAAPSYTNAQSNALSLQTDGSLRVAVTNANSGGTSLTDGGTFTVTMDAFTPIGGVMEVASPSACAEGKGCAARLTAARGLNVVLADSAGNFLTPSADYTEDAAIASAHTGPVILTYRQDVPSAATSSATAEWADLTSNAYGALWVSQVDPCSSEAKTTTEFSTTTSAVLVAAAASKKNYICSMIVVAGAAEIVNISEGTGTKCGTSTAALAGSTTAANGLSFAANGGFIGVGGNSSVFAGRGTNVDTCIIQSGSNRIAGSVTWVRR